MQLQALVLQLVVLVLLGHDLPLQVAVKHQLQQAWVCFGGRPTPDGTATT